MGFHTGVRVALASVLALVVLGCARDSSNRVSLVITNGLVITMDPDRRVLANAAIAVNDGEIVAVDTSANIASRFRAVETIDARGQVVMPGLVNTHTHAPMVLYRGLADDLPLERWLNDYIFPAEAKTVSPEFVRAGTRLAALEMIRSGTTTFADMYYFEEEIARETKAAGLRGVLGQTIIGFPVADAKTPADGLTRAAAFIEAFAKDPLITPAVAPHAAYTLDGPMLVASRQLADQHRVPMLIHVAESQSEVTTVQERYKTTPVRYLESLGVLGPGTVAAHGIYVSEQEMPLLKERGVAVSHNPESNMKLASGVAPITELIDAGVVVGLGTDGAASNNDLDMFEAMRMASFLQKVHKSDPAVAGARTVLEMATLGGARSLGMEGRIGSIEPRKRADLLIVRMDQPRQSPLYDPISQIVYTTRGDDVQTTVVNGRVLMRDRKVLTVDEAAVLKEASTWAGRIREAVGAKADASAVSQR